MAFTQAPRALAVPPAPRARLELSGPRLTRVLESLIASTDEQGGIERYVAALKVKVALFQQALGEGHARDVDLKTFRQLCAVIATVRRRASDYLEMQAFSQLRSWIVELLATAGDTTAADAGIADFCSNFPADRNHRWVRDLAAEVLHNVDPQRYPLMCRWVWDARANTGALREIWHAEDVDHIIIDVPDRHDTFVVLREELSQFLTDNGVFRDVVQYVDLLTAQVYADYIAEQGGSYLRTDFATPEEPLLYARRLLGLDVAPNGRTRLKAIDGEAFVAQDPRLPH